MGAFFVAYGVAVFALSLGCTSVRRLGIGVVVGNLVYTPWRSSSPCWPVSGR